MAGFAIVFLIGLAAGWGSFTAWGVTWGIVCGVTVMLVCWAVLGLILRRAIMAKQMVVQNIMQEAQRKVNRQMEMFQRRPPSSMNAARLIVEKIQFDAVRESLEALKDFSSLYKWNPMLRRQVTAMQVQLYYQLRDYKKVDELLPSALAIDPQTIAIKLVRMYRNEDKALDRFFTTRCRRFKGENAAFLACVYAWMKLKKSDSKAALNALLTAKKSSDHPVLMENIETLVNGREKHFSNSGFGDLWYALALEEPKVKQPKRQMGRGF